MEVNPGVLPRKTFHLRFMFLYPLRRSPTSVPVFLSFLANTASRLRIPFRFFTFAIIGSNVKEVNFGGVAPGIGCRHAE